MKKSHPIEQTSEELRKLQKSQAKDPHPAANRFYHVRSMREKGSQLFQAAIYNMEPPPLPTALAHNARFPEDLVKYELR